MWRPRGLRRSHTAVGESDRSCELTEENQALAGMEAPTRRAKEIHPTTKLRAPLIGTVPPEHVGSYPELPICQNANHPARDVEYLDGDATAPRQLQLEGGFGVEGVGTASRRERRMVAKQGIE